MEWENERMKLVWNGEWKNTEWNTAVYRTYTKKALKVKDKGALPKVCLDNFSWCLEAHCRVEMERCLQEEEKKELM